ncbi:MAG: transcription termination/antitermination protein NusG [Bacillota bacterium]
MIAETMLVAADELLWQPLVDGDEHQWRVLHVKSRQEKSLSEALTAMGIAHYLPLIWRQCYYGNRRAVVKTPLFPSYVFLRGTLDDAYRADRTKRLANVICVADQRQIDWELRNLRLALTNHAPLDVHAFLTRGVRVRVQSGPFRGLEGVIEDRSKTGRLVLQVRMLGSASSLEIDGSLLELLE